VIEITLVLRGKSGSFAKTCGVGRSFSARGKPIRNRQDASQERRWTSEGVGKKRPPHTGVKQPFAIVYGVYVSALFNSLTASLPPALST
jgi:hypothetical protein